MRFLLIFILFVSTSQTFAQNIGADLERVLGHVPAIKQGDTSAIAPLEETICLLAYYAGMPDTARVRQLADGPALMEYFADNRAMREFLLQAGIAQQIEAHRVIAPDHYLDSLFRQKRSRFLDKRADSDLFGPAGEVNLERIRQSVTAPVTKQFSLASASNAAASRGLDVAPSALVSSALAGLSDFIAKRAQQELTYTFLERLREYLRANELNYLFPETSNYLPDLDLLNYKAILPSIRRAFAQDLHAVSFNLGRFLEARDVDSFRDPAVYNIFLVYRILDLELRDVPLPDILAFTYGELNRSRSALRSEIDLKIAADRGETEEFTKLINSFGAYAGAVRGLNGTFMDAIELTDNEINSYIDLLDSVVLTEEEITVYANDLVGLSNILGNLRLPLGRKASADRPDAANNAVILSWLAGEESYDYYQAYPSLTKFDEFFGPDAEPFDATKRRAAGLRAIREILDREDLLDVYRDQYTTLNEARVGLFNLTEAFRDDRMRAVYMDRPHTLFRDTLSARITAEMEKGDHPALALLRSLLITTPSEKQAAFVHLKAVEERFERWRAQNRPGSSALVGRQELAQRGLLEFDELEKNIRRTAEAYTDLRAALVNFNKIRAGGDMSDAYQNLTTFETVFGIAQQTFFLLADSGDDALLFLDKEETSVFQTDAGARQLLAGITRERMKGIPALGKLNTAATLDFLLDFSLYLSEYQSRKIDGLEDTNFGEQMKRRAAVDFFTTTLQTLLSAPILENPAFTLGADGAKPNVSLAERYAGFSKVPAVNGELRELFRLSQDGDYRYAIDNLLNLVEILEVYPDSSKRTFKLETERDRLLAERADLLKKLYPDQDYPGANALDGIATVPDPGLIQISGATKVDLPLAVDTVRLFKLNAELAKVETKLANFRPKAYKRFQESFFKYGTFMSDVVAAESPNDVERALNNVALPPGSSQIKRNRSYSIELGAYFGAALASETLVLPVDEADRSLEDARAVVSLFVPVGLSYSRNLGRRRSGTLFASILDLGGITAFRIQDRNQNERVASVERLPEFSLRNVVAPGLHLLYNFPRSPFSVGFGVQDGPSVRRYTPAGSMETREARSVRFMVTGSVDVPIFRFGGD